MPYATYVSAAVPGRGIIALDNCEEARQCETEPKVCWTKRALWFGRAGKRKDTRPEDTGCDAIGADVCKDRR